MLTLESSREQTNLPPIHTTHSTDDPDDLNKTVIQNCRWCQMKEEDMLEALFKEEQINRTSIHLHALSYTVVY